MFVAVRLPREVLVGWSQLLVALDHLDQSVRPVRPEGLHLTLAFLGRMGSAQRTAAARVSADVAARHRPFPVRLGTIGSFPPSGPPAVIWAGVALGVAELTALSDDLRSGLAGERLPCDRRPLSLHCTLARVKGALGEQSIGRWGELDQQVGPAGRATFSAATLELMESVAVGGGPNRFDTVAQAVLRG